MSRKNKSATSEETVETRAKRIAISATVAGVLLIVFLVVVLAIQFAKIGVRNSEKSRLQYEVERYRLLNEETEKDLDFFKTQEGLRMLAVMNGYKK